MTTIEERISLSKGDFLDFVWPTIGRAVGEGTLISAEGNPDELSKQLDFIGIDYLFTPKGGQPFGISQRTTYGSWNTVTMNPESLKRLTLQWGRAGSLLPAVHVQSYLLREGNSTKGLHSVAVVTIDKFLKYVKENEGSRRTNHSQGSRFLTWDFEALEAAGVTSLTIPASGLRDPFGPSLN